MSNQTVYLTEITYTKDGYLDYDPLLIDDQFVPFEFEKMDFRAFATFVHKNWFIGPIVGVGYIIFIFALQHWMKNRKPFDLKRELFLWNAGLGIFSICGLIRSAPEFFFQLNKEDGLYRTICVIEGGSIPTLFWGILFTLSKFVELGDTVFIVLRKKPLILLHWYHHFITMAAAWLMLPYLEPVNRYLCVLNFGVHSLMYPYFALRALNVSIPRKIANVITTLQFTQMIIAFIVIGSTAILYYTGVPCYRNPFTLKLSFAVCVSFNILFGNLFYTSVILKNRKKKVQ